MRAVGFAQHQADGRHAEQNRLLGDPAAEPSLIAATARRAASNAAPGGGVCPSRAHSNPKPRHRHMPPAAEIALAPAPLFSCRMAWRNVACIDQRNGPRRTRANGHAVVERDLRPRS